MSSQRVIEPLIELVQEEEPTVRYTAADALARTAGQLIGAGKQDRRGGEVTAESMQHERKAARRSLS
jgi:HEAT repeat protein